MNLQKDPGPGCRTHDKGGDGSQTQEIGPFFTVKNVMAFWMGKESCNAQAQIGGEAGEMGGADGSAGRRSESRILQPAGTAGEGEQEEVFMNFVCMAKSSKLRQHTGGARQAKAQAAQDHDIIEMGGLFPVDASFHQNARDQRTHEEEKRDQDDAQCFRSISLNDVHPEQSGKAGDVTHESPGCHEAAGIDRTRIETHQQPVEKDFRRDRLMKLVAIHAFDFSAEEDYSANAKFNATWRRSGID